MKNLRASSALPIVALALGVCAGVLRYFEITRGLSAAGLVTGSPLVPVMRIAAVAGCVLLAVAAFASKPNGGEYTELFAPKLPKTIAVVSGFGFIFAGLVGMITGYFPTRSMLRLVLAAFAAFCGATTVVSVGKPPQEGERDSRCMLAAMPVFAYSYLLIAIYVLHSGDASIELFGYKTVAGVALCAAAYFSASSAYGQQKPRAALAASLIAAFLSMLVAVGELLVRGDVQVAAFFIAAAVWSTAVAAALVAPQPEPVPEEESKTE